MTKLLNPSFELMSSILQEAGWTTEENPKWFILISPPDDDGNMMDLVFPIEPYTASEAERCRANIANYLDDVGLIELAKPDANGWYKVSEVELVDRQEYLVYDDLCENVLVVRYRQADDLIGLAPTQGKPWWDMAYSEQVFPYKAFLYFQPLPMPPVGHPKKPDYMHDNVKAKS